MNRKDKKKGAEQTRPEKKQKKQRAGVVRTALFGVAFGLCASAIVGLSVALYYAQQNIETHETYQRQMDAVYSRAYYDLMDGASDLGITLRKIGVSNSKEMQQSLLYEVWNVAQLAEDNLGMFESQDDGILQAQKFVNQLGDYSHTLALRMADGKSLSVDERQKLLQFGEMADVYKRALESVGEGVDSEKMFMEEGGALENFLSAFSAFTEPSFEYPEMIYDGPFSSALENRQTLGLTGKEITREEAQKKMGKYFKGYGASNIEFIGDGEGNIPTYNFSLNLKGENAFVQLSKKGGMLISLNASQTANSVSKNEASATCQQTAIEFAKNVGFDNMQVVWSSSSNGVCVINLAPLQDGVILYPDLVKVKVAEQSQAVLGFDSTHYAYNHKQREIATPGINQEMAKMNLSLQTEDEGRLALIPLRETREVLAYEFECESNGTYYVYIDAMSGEEVNILYVIEDDLGMRTI